MRLGAIEGYSGRSNDIVCSISKQRHQEPSDVVVFFPGDIQNYAELMSGHCDDEDIPRWNLEAVAESLSKKMPTKDIIVVKPSRTVKGVFNHYDNFVTMNQFGGPDYLKGRSALPHLFHLILNVLAAVRPDLKHQPEEEGTSQETKKDSNGSPASCAGRLEHSTMKNDDEDQKSCSTSELKIDKTPIDYNINIKSITLVGFSKGCVVLNQLVTEIYLMSELPDEEKQLCTTLLQKV